MGKFYSILILFGFMLFGGCQKVEKEEADQEVISQEDDNQTANVPYALPGLDHGLIQSPINILSFETKEVGRHEIIANFEDEINAVENLGHTIQLDFKPGSTITFKDKVYDFVQCHFHTPSEHRIDGITFPMELHFVNVRKDPNEDQPEYLVISALFKMGTENKFIGEFINLIPEEGEKRDVEIGVIRVDDLLEGSEDEEHPFEGYYNYKGSLTTPPYTESVNWLLARRIFEASPEQIEIINMLEGDNARHVQASYGRVVEGEM